MESIILTARTLREKSEVRPASVHVHGSHNFKFNDSIDSLSFAFLKTYWYRTLYNFMINTISQQSREQKQLSLVGSNLPNFQAFTY